MSTPAFSYNAPSTLITATLPTDKSIRLSQLPVGQLYFVDVNADYGQTAGEAIITEDKAIRGQIRNVLSTPLGSEDFEPDYGSMLPFRILDPVTALTAWQIENDTIGAVDRWLKGRIRLNRNQCYVQPVDEEGEGYYVRLSYQIVRTNAVVSWNFSIYR